ncbi:MAG: hypothetical protein Q8L85_10325 [Alphaproteobacteria bacterium]|nr:hypothetical protein [Alphaproteobacteria bacterium]
MKFSTKVSLFLFAMFLNYTANAGSGDEMDLDADQHKIELKADSNNNTTKRKKFKRNNNLTYIQNRATKRTIDEFYDDSDESINELSLYNDGCYKSNTNTIIINQIDIRDTLNTNKTKKHDSHPETPEIELEQGLQNANTNEHETNFEDELSSLLGNIYIDFGNGNTNGSYVESNFKKSLN